MACKSNLRRGLQFFADVCTCTFTVSEDLFQWSFNFTFLSLRYCKYEIANLNYRRYESIIFTSTKALGWFLIAATRNQPQQGMRAAAVLWTTTAPLQKSICQRKNKGEFFLNPLMSIPEAFQRVGGGYWGSNWDVFQEWIFHLMAAHQHT